MPPILSMGPADPDSPQGFRIVFSGDRAPLVLRRNNVPGNVRAQGVQAVQDWCDSWLQDRLSVVIDALDDVTHGKRVWVVHASTQVRSVNPFLVDVTLNSTEDKRVEDV